MYQTLKFAVVFTLSFLIISCSKDDEDNDSRENYFACKIDGTDWEANGVNQPTVTKQELANDISANRLDFFGSPSGGQSISITVTDFRNGGDGECLNDETFYGSDSPNAGSAFTVTGANGTTYISDCTLTLSGNPLSRTGFIEITDCGDGMISGEFEFTIKDITGAVLHEITEGEFVNVAYTYF